MNTSINLSAIARRICDDLGLTYKGEAGEGAFKQTFHVSSHEGLSMALKVYKTGYPAARSDRELHAMQTCRHSSIARLFAVDNYALGEQTVLYSLEEYLEGSTLTEHIVKNGLCDITSLLDLGECLIDAVGHIAGHGFVHRDLKPDNIMLRGEAGPPVIVDFGLVRDLNAETLTAEWMVRGPGTPYFAAPEQLNNSKELIDWRTDQFSLGVVLACCSCGFHPYDVGDVDGTVHAAAQHQGPTPQFTEHVTNAGVPILQKMVAPWPVLRFRTPNELAEAWRRQRVL